SSVSFTNISAIREDGLSARQSRISSSVTVPVNPSLHRRNLAACNTGGAGAGSADRTGLLGSGEALGGLARDFIYAGSRSLIVSQWEVDREATASLMVALFEGEQESQGDAFRHAQLTLMNDRKFSHPYYWAAFSLVGDAMRPMPGN